MPNHVMNILEYDGPVSEIKRMQTLLSQPSNDGEGKPTAFNFQNIIPMPESLDIKSGTLTDQALRYVITCAGDRLTQRERDAVKREEARHKQFLITVSLTENTDRYAPMSPEELEQFEKSKTLSELGEAQSLGCAALSNLVNYDAMTWYDWRWREWGTKWNAYEVEAGDGVYYFETAWSPATPVIAKLAAMFPTISFRWRWADENYGENIGDIRYDWGRVTSRKEDPDFETRKEAIQFSKEVWGDDSPDEDEEVVDDDDDGGDNILDGLDTAATFVDDLGAQDDASN